MKRETANSFFGYLVIYTKKSLEKKLGTNFPSQGLGNVYLVKSIQRECPVTIARGSFSSQIGCLQSSMKHISFKVNNNYINSKMQL